MEFTDEEMAEINNWSTADFANEQTEQLNKDEIKEIEKWSDSDFTG